MDDASSCLSGLSAKEIEERVTKNFSVLVTSLDAEQLSDYLIEGQIITIDQWQYIDNTQHTKQGKCRQLLSHLSRMRNPGAYFVFANALERNPQWRWIRDILKCQETQTENRRGTDCENGAQAEYERRLEEARLEWAKEKEELLEKQRQLEKLLHDMQLSADSSSFVSSSVKKTATDTENQDYDTATEREGDEMEFMTNLISRVQSRLSMKSETRSRQSFGKSFISGKIFLQISYKQSIQRLDIVIVKCKGLAPVDRRHRCSNPYVKSYLLPDERKTSKRKTDVIENSLNPEFMETFVYKAPFDEVEAYTLWISVWHKAKFGRNQILGEVVIPLEQSLQESKIEDWYYLDKPLR